ncbi:MAG: glyoxalase [Dokdonella sp.]|nr:glyoxalase [Dokdonella sp.]MCB1571350.1 glyoxalase [Xanthomonadales bacterium]
MNTVCTIIPALRYRDAPAAIEWLCKAFGFEKHGVYADDAGGIAHAQLTFGNGMIMLSTANDNEWGRRMAQPDQIDGRETQCPCVIVSDPDAHYAMTLAAGATIIDELKDNDYGGRGYSCRDPEGHMWWFGSYDPWKEAGS